MAPSVDRQLAAVGAEHHRPVVGGFGDDRYRPSQLPPVAGQVRQQFHHGPPAGDGGGHGLDTGVPLGQPGLILADEPPQLPVAADLACAGVIDHHLARPHSLQGVGVTLVQRGEVLRDRISLACGASLPARQLHRAGEVRKPRHLNPLLLAGRTYPCRLPSCVLRQPTHPQGQLHESPRRSCTGMRAYRSGSARPYLPAVSAEGNLFVGRSPRDRPPSLRQRSVRLHRQERSTSMPSPVVHFEIRSSDPDATRLFFGKLFGWTFPDGGIPGYSYVDTESRARYPVASARCRAVRRWSRSSSGFRMSPRPWTPRWRRAERSSSRRHRCPGSPSGCWPTRRDRWLDWPRPTAEASGGGPARAGQLTGGGSVCRSC